MTTDILGGIIRAILPILIAWLVKRGIPEDQATILAGRVGDAAIGIATAVAVAWSIWSNYVKKREIKELKATVNVLAEPKVNDDFHTARLKTTVQNNG